MPSAPTATEFSTFTSWFRSPDLWPHFTRALTRMSKTRSSVTVWCGACGTGQEPYSWAIKLDETGIPGRVIASDIRPDAVAYARRGVYTDHQIAGLNHSRRAAFLTPDDDGWRVTKPIRTRVEYSVADLAHDPVPNDIDIAVVTNVWRFLDDDAQERLADALHTSLRSGGILVLAGSDFVRPRTARHQRSYLSPAFTGVRLPAIEERFTPYAYAAHDFGAFVWRRP